MDQVRQRDLHYLSLVTAATVAYMRLTGKAPGPGDVPTVQRILNDVAHALSLVAPIHRLDGVGAQTVIDDAALAVGRFEQGGAVLVLPDGRKFGGLMLQLKDLDAAVQILKHTPLCGQLRSARP